MYYTYILKDGDTPFYVGKGTKNRMYVHVSKAKNTKTNNFLLNKIRRMVKNKKKITYEKVLVTENEQEAFDKEVELIKKIGRKDLKLGPLTNTTNGGEGVKGYIWTEQHKKNLSRSIKKAIKEGRFNPALNIDKKSSEYKKNMSVAMKNYYTNNPRSIETRKKLSEHGKSLLVDGKRILSKEAREKMGSGSGRVWTKEMREQHSLALKKAWKKRNISKDK